MKVNYAVIRAGSVSTMCTSGGHHGKTGFLDSEKNMW